MLGGYAMGAFACRDGLQAGLGFSEGVVGW